MAYDIRYPIKDRIKAEKKKIYVFFETYTIGKGGLQMRLTHYALRFEKVNAPLKHAECI